MAAAITLSLADATEVLVRTAQDLSEATGYLLAEIPLHAPELDRETALSCIIQPLAGALATALDLLNDWDEDDGQLRGALQRWLP